MNLYFRLYLMFLTVRFKSAIRILDKYVTKHRVQPGDIDLFCHMNNGRYFTVTDIVRIEMLIRAGIWQVLKKKGLGIVNAGQTVQFLRPLEKFAEYEIHTKTLGWDKKFVYVEHRFIKEGKLHALLMIKSAIIGGKTVSVSPAEIIGQAMNEHVEEIKITKSIQEWNQATQDHRRGR